MGEVAPIPTLARHAGSFSGQTPDCQPDSSDVRPFRVAPRQWGQSSARAEPQFPTTSHKASNSEVRDIVYSTK